MAATSHQRAAAADAADKFAAEIAPVTVQRRGKSVTVSEDEGIRPDSTPAARCAAAPAFTDDGLMIAAAIRSQLSDGAAALLLASEAAVETSWPDAVGAGVGGAAVGVTPWRFVEGPSGHR